MGLMGRIHSNFAEPRDLVYLVASNFSAVIAAIHMAGVWRQARPKHSCPCPLDGTP